MRRTDVVAFVCGVLFAVGLALSRMTQLSRVLGFLDVAGAWDPTLLFVMMGAVAVHVFARRTSPPRRPMFAATFSLPTATRVDRRLVAGAALFGFGWGIAGYCPGPALVSIVTHASAALVFVASMVAGMIAHASIFERSSKSSSTAVEC